MGKKYTEKADVYAFGIILWEILTRLEPYEDKEPMQIVVEVVNDGLRPVIPGACASSPLVPLMQDCWHSEPDQRPSFERVLERLKQIDALIPQNDTSEYGTKIMIPRRQSVLSPTQQSSSSSASSSSSSASSHQEITVA